MVEYKANDSIVFLGNNMAYMYGQGVVNYQDIELDADEIRMNMDSSMVYAVGRPDTAGEIVGNPIYKDKSGEYESKTMQFQIEKRIHNKYHYPARRRILDRRTYKKNGQR